MKMLTVLEDRESQWKRPRTRGLKRSVRTRIMEWLHEQSELIGLHQRTIMLAMSLLDRFMSTRRITTREAEALTLACIWVAAKYEEVFTSESILEMSSVTVAELVAAERELLTALDFRLTIPTPFDFMEAVLFEKLNRVPMLYTPAQMVIRHTALHLPKYRPSELAWAALVAADFDVSVPADPELVAEMKKGM